MQNMNNQPGPMAKAMSQAQKKATTPKVVNFGYGKRDKVAARLDKDKSGSEPHARYYPYET